MFTKILVANRGEIACRIFRCCQKLGIQGVAVYSDPDANSLHVRSADLAIRLPGATSVETYLQHDLIIQAAKTSGSEAIHPGYGFLSENAEFARKVAEAGLIFIGPTPETMQLLGDKIASRKLAESCKLPLLPELLIDVNKASNSTYLKSLDTAARQIGYPLIVKAAAGGGGRGMRMVGKFEELADAITAACREAETCFGDKRVYLEKYISGARHVEVQIIGDSSGTIHHLRERDCSLQRRHQKVIEEAPLTNRSLAQQLLEAATRICSAAKYTGAGTVEFLVSDSGDFYFLEVNSRLQVEHPVTEAVLGVDLVELQLRVAAGEKLPEDLSLRETQGFAVECRICAEDPQENFLAAAGKLRQFSFPSRQDIRVDSGFEGGDTVSHYYDSLLAKLISHAKTRTEAIEQAIDALTQISIAGVTTNIPFLLDLLRSEKFRDNLHDLQHTNKVLKERRPCPKRLAHAAALYVLARQTRAKLAAHAQHKAFATSGWRLTGSKEQRLKLAIDRHVGLFTVQHTADGSLLCQALDEQDAGLAACALRMTGYSGNQFHYQAGTVSQSCTFLAEGDSHLWISSPCGPVEVREEYALQKAGERASGLLPSVLSSKLPATVLEIKVTEGSEVEADAVLLTLESMKMEHAVRSPAKAIVQMLAVKAGQTVEAGAPLLELQYCASE